MGTNIFDWHTYASLNNNVLFASYPRKYLDEYGYKNCEIHVGEWNPSTKYRGTLYDASNILSNMIAMHSTPTDMMLYYDFRFWSSYCGPVTPITFKPFKAYYSFYAFGQLYALGQCVECSSDTSGIYALAATDGKKRGIVVVNNKDEEVTVTVNDQCADRDVKIYVTDEQNDFSETEKDISNMNIHAYGFVFIEM